MQTNTSAFSSLLPSPPPPIRSLLSSTSLELGRSDSIGGGGSVVGKRSSAASSRRSSWNTSGSSPKTSETLQYGSFDSSILTPLPALPNASHTAPFTLHGSPSHSGDISPEPWFNFNLASVGSDLDRPRTPSTGWADGAANSTARSTVECIRNSSGPDKTTNAFPIDPFSTTDCSAEFNIPDLATAFTATDSSPCLLSDSSDAAVHTDASGLFSLDLLTSYASTEIVRENSCGVCSDAHSSINTPATLQVLVGGEENTLWQNLSPSPPSEPIPSLPSVVTSAASTSSPPTRANDSSCPEASAPDRKTKRLSPHCAASKEAVYPIYTGDGELYKRLKDAKRSVGVEMFLSTPVALYLSLEDLDVCSQVCKLWYAEIYSIDKLRKIYKKGIPAARRRLLWKMILLGETNYCTAENYKILSETVNSCESEIKRDIGRTYPAQELFQGKDSEGQQGLLRILRACSNHFADVGYCQGMNFVAATLLLLFDELTAYRCLLALMTQYSMKDFYLPTFPRFKVTVFQLDKLIEVFLPNIYNKLLKHDITADFYCMHWFMTLFSYDVDRPALYKIWDNFLLRGWKVIFKVGLMLLYRIQDKLIHMQFDDALKFLKVFPKDPTFGYLDGDELIASSEMFPVSNRMLTELENAYHHTGHAVVMCLRDLDSNTVVWDVHRMPTQMPIGRNETNDSLSTTNDMYNGLPFPAKHKKYKGIHFLHHKWKGQHNTASVVTNTRGKKNDPTMTSNASQTTGSAQRRPPDTPHRSRPATPSPQQTTPRIVPSNPDSTTDSAATRSVIMSASSAYVEQIVSFGNAGVQTSPDGCHMGKPTTLGGPHFQTFCDPPIFKTVSPMARRVSPVATPASSSIQCVSESDDSEKRDISDQSSLNHSTPASCDFAALNGNVSQDLWLPPPKLPPPPSPCRPLLTHGTNSACPQTQTRNPGNSFTSVASRTSVGYLNPGHLSPVTPGADNILEYFHL